MITVANAPVSYGVFDLARPERVPLPAGGELLDAVAATVAAEVVAPADPADEGSL